jgi:hypothetical protein
MTILENRRLLATVVAAAVVVACIVGLYLAGSPAEARLLRLDDRRVDDLRSISWSLAEYRRGRGRLPPTLDSLPMAISDAPRLRDPVTNRPYSYEVTGDSSYSLCAEFARPSSPEGGGSSDASWRHGPGHFCFPLTATARQ